MKQIKIILKGIIVVLVLFAIIIAVFLFNARHKGIVEPISFHSDINLEGVLVKPDNPGPHPAILLLHGAGSKHQGHNKLYFKFHANAFVDEGFAVMIYSKRSSDDVDYKYFTYEDLLNDAHAAISFLKQRKDIDHNNVGVMGVSESGWFTPELAYNNPDIKFLINRVSSPLNVVETISHEVRSDALSEGFSEEDIAHVILPLTKRIWKFYVDVNEGRIPENGFERKAIDSTLEKLNQDKHFGNWFIYSQLGDYDSLLYKSRADRYSYDPMPFFNKISVPMLYVMAGKDINIPTKKVVATLEKAQLEEEKNITIKVYPEASHYLYKHGLGDGPYEGWMYYDDYLDLITTWAKEQIVMDD